MLIASINSDTVISFCSFFLFRTVMFPDSSSLSPTTTIQVDFMMPINFNLQYVNQAGKKENLVMLHRAVFGSYERFMAILI